MDQTTEQLNPTVPAEGTPENPYVIEMLHITKEFPGIKANDDITLQLKRGEIHALLGENGAGKSTLMSVLFGLYQPEKGEIRKNGEVVKIKDPNDATALNIGMVHQHFKLIDVFTVLDNIILGAEDTKFGFLQKKQAKKKVQELSERYGLKIDISAKIEDITVGMQQRVEILKMLYRDNDILIFDEPTAVLTPQEIVELMDIMRNLKAEGKSILFISHKLNEIMEVSDRVTVLRKGRYIGTVETKDTTKEELSRMMVGRPVQLVVDKDDAKPGDPVLTIEGLTVPSKLHKNNAVKNVSLQVRKGEIVCIAGIDGNGQTEFVHALTGLENASAGTIHLSVDSKKALEAAESLFTDPERMAKEYPGFNGKKPHLPVEKMKESILAELKSDGAVPAVKASPAEEAAIALFPAGKEGSVPPTPAELRLNSCAVFGEVLLGEGAEREAAVKACAELFNAPSDELEALIPRKCRITRDITKYSIRKRSLSGMSHIPEDRHKHGLVLDFTLEQNMVLQRYFEPRFQKAGFIRFGEIRRYAEGLIDKFDVRSGQGPVTTARSMSGGNQQKAIVARELDRDMPLIVAVQPTRGLDVGAIEFIHKQLVEERDKGKAVLLVSLELEEVMNLSDRILVMYEGEIVGELEPKKTTVEELGLYMAGAKRQNKEVEAK